MTRLTGHVAVADPRNGLFTHAVNPAAGSAVAGTPFTYTAGRFGVIVAYGAVTFTSPSGWTLAASTVNYGGLYVWYKASLAGGETVSFTSNGSNYPIVVDFYEFPAASTWVGVVSASNIAPWESGPNLTSLTGTNQVYVAGGQADSGPASWTGAWGSGTPLVATCVPGGGGLTDGYVYGSAEFVDDTATSQSDAWFYASGPNAERLVWAVQVHTGGTPTPALVLSSWDGSAWRTTAVPVWDGSAWKTSARSYWNGSAWV